MSFSITEPGQAGIDPNPSTNAGTSFVSALAPASRTARPGRAATTVAATNAATSSGPIAPSATCWRSPSAYVPARISVTRPVADSVRVGVEPAEMTDTSNPAASSAAAPRSSAVTSSSATPPAAPGRYA